VIRVHPRTLMLPKGCHPRESGDPGPSRAVLDNDKGKPLRIAFTAVAALMLLPLANCSSGGTDTPTASLSQEERIAELMFREELPRLANADPTVICVAIEAEVDGSYRRFEPSAALVQQLEARARSVSSDRRVVPMSACRCGGPISERSTGERAVLFVAEPHSSMGNMAWWYPDPRPARAYVVRGEGREMQVIRGIGEVAVDTFGNCPLGS
jgi:hypothetical protein